MIVPAAVVDLFVLFGPGADSRDPLARVRTARARRRCRRRRPRD
jgi:hypothetical protein